MKKPIIYLTSAIIGQLIILCSIYLFSMLPFITGEAIQLNVIPVDPRSLFRGNYAQLNYDISTLPRNTLPTDIQLRHGEKIYVSLKENEQGIFQFDQVNLSKPQDSTFIRGRIDYSYDESMYVLYGIEAFFAPKEKAIALENQLRTGGIAIIMLDHNGKARLKEIVSSSF